MGPRGLNSLALEGRPGRTPSVGRHSRCQTGLGGGEPSRDAVRIDWPSQESLHKETPRSLPANSASDTSRHTSPSPDQIGVEIDLEIAVRTGWLVPER